MKDSAYEPFSREQLNVILLMKFLKKITPVSLKMRLMLELRKFGLKLTPYDVVGFHQHHLKVNAYLRDLFLLIDHIPGVVVECGYGEGSSFLILSSICSTEGRSLKGFDSFRGFPEPTQEDSSPRNPKKGEWSIRTLEEAKLQIQGFGLDPAYVNSNIQLIAGYVEETLHKNLPTEPIAFLHIDLDLYSAYKCTLETLFPLVAIGGIVLFDEYNQKNWPGAKLAVDEYFQTLPYEIKQHSSGKYYVVKVPSK